MKSKTVELFEVNTDVIGLLHSFQKIGWTDLREHSIHRVLYLSGILFAFVYPGRLVPYTNYHFSISSSGPFSTVVKNSILDLKRRKIIAENSQGEISIQSERIKGMAIQETEKTEWFKTVIYILGKYGESRVFGFVIQDPQYKEYFNRNSQKDINMSGESKTIDFLNLFKKTFEDSLQDVNNIDEREYLELYFEYIFSRIVKKES